MAKLHHPLGNLERSFEQFTDGWQVWQNFTHPRHTTLYYNREQMKVIWHYMNSAERQLGIRRIWHGFVIFQIISFMLSLMYGLQESLDSIVDLGQDVLWVLAAFFLSFKTIYFLFYADDIDEIVDALEDFHHYQPKAGSKVQLIRSTQRYYFLLETGLSICWYFAMVFFSTLVISTPLWTAQKLPFHAAYPFHLQDPTQHPLAHLLIFITQTCLVLYFIPWILYTELYSVHCFSQLAVNFEVLRIELSDLAGRCRGDETKFLQELNRLIRFHQRIIYLGDRVNEVFYAPMIMQMIMTFLMLALSTFETLAARHEHDIAARFVLFMLMNFFHLSYSTKFGDMVTDQSQLVSLSAYDAYEGPEPLRSRDIQRDIMFIIQRTQKPLIMAASPFPPFNLVSYMAILKQFYSILTVMLKYLD